MDSAENEEKRDAILDYLGATFFLAAFDMEGIPPDLLSRLWEREEFLRNEEDELALYSATSVYFSDLTQLTAELFFERDLAGVLLNSGGLINFHIFEKTDPELYAQVLERLDIFEQEEAMERAAGRNLFCLEEHPSEEITGLLGTYIENSQEAQSVSIPKLPDGASSEGSEIGEAILKLAGFYIETCRQSIHVHAKEKRRDLDREDQIDLYVLEHLEPWLHGFIADMICECQGLPRPYRPKTGSFVNEGEIKKGPTQ